IFQRAFTWTCPVLRLKPGHRVRDHQIHRTEQLMKRVMCVVAGITVAASVAFAQGPGGGAPAGIAIGLQRAYAALKTNLTQSAEKMSEADYTFKPTNEIRNYGQLWGHVANAQFGQCAQARAVANPSMGVDFETKTTKAD